MKLRCMWPAVLTLCALTACETDAPAPKAEAVDKPRTSASPLRNDTATPSSPARTTQGDATPSPSDPRSRETAPPPAPAQDNTAPKETERAAQAAPGDALIPQDAPRSFSPLVDKANPSVVNIYTKVVVRERVRTLDPFFPFAPRQRLSESLGTGFIIDEAGLILTNHHVIEGAAQIKVRTSDGQEFNAKVVGADPPTDLAVIKLQDAPRMTPLPMGDSDQARVGDWVVAIGNALGLSSTVTVGIVSAKGRTSLPIKGQLRHMDFIQTDASINPGNSGGPLLDMQGRVVGINTLINREGQGIGFAIPINTARTIVEPLIRDGRIERSWLGIYVRETSEPGAHIQRIVPGGPADRAGLRVNDVILEFDGQTIRDKNDLRIKSSLAGIGRQVSLLVRRGDETLSMTMTMGRSPRE